MTTTKSNGLKIICSHQNIIFANYSITYYKQELNEKQQLYKFVETNVNDVLRNYHDYIKQNHLEVCIIFIL